MSISCRAFRSWCVSNSCDLAGCTRFICFFCGFRRHRGLEIFRADQIRSCDAQYDAFKESGWRAFIEQIFLVQALGPTGNALTFNAAAWSISVEFYTYLVFGLTVLFAGRLKHSFSAVCVPPATLLITKRTVRLHRPGALHRRLLHRLPHRHDLQSITMQLPSLSGRHVSHVRRFSGASPQWRLQFLRLCYDGGTDGHPDPGADRFASMAGCIRCSSDTFSPGSARSPIPSICHIRRYMGNQSGVSRRAQAAVLFLDDRMTPQLPFFATLIAYVCVVLCVLVVSQLTFKLIEEPLRQKSRSMGFPGNFEYRR